MYGARLGRLAGGTALLLALVFFVLPSSASAQTLATTCGYGTTGPLAENLCWFDMTGYNDTLARSAAGQQMTVALPGGYTASFTIRSTPIAGRIHVGVDVRNEPLEARFPFGNVGYVGIPGSPILYSRAANPAGVTLTLSDIVVRDASGAVVSGYQFVIADTENNIATANESFTWRSDKPLNLVAVLNPDAVKGCDTPTAPLAGLGTTTVTCTGQGADPGPYDNVLVGADTPSFIALDLRTNARSGVAFAIQTAKIQVTKTVVGRARAADSFDIEATSPEGSTIGSATTGAANTATTGEFVVLPRTAGTFYTLSEAATPGSGTVLSDYVRSWSCTNNGVADPSLPTGSETSVAVSPAAGDFIACTITNTAPARVAVVAESTNWTLGLQSGEVLATFLYGNRPLTPMMGDWDGDGLKTAGTFESGTFRLNNQNDGSAADITFVFGNPRAYAVAGDYDGNGYDDVALYRKGVWEIHYLGPGAPADETFTLRVPFGQGIWPYTVPVAGDWDGDGIDGIGTYDSATGTWVLKNTVGAGPPDIDPFVFWGGSGSYPVVGDFGGIGRDTPGYRVGTTWTVRTEAVTGGATDTFDFGVAGSIPLTW